MNLGFSNDRSLPKRERRRKAFESPSGSSLKETEDSLDPRVEDRMGKPDYTGDISQSSWEWDIVTRDDMWVEGRNIGRVSDDGEKGRLNLNSAALADMSGECGDDDGEDENDDAWKEMNSNRSSDFEEANGEIEDDDDSEGNDVSDEGKNVVSVVWKELTAISLKLQSERKKLRIKEEEVLEREMRVLEAENRFEDFVDDAVEKRMGGDDGGGGGGAEDSVETDWRRKSEKHLKNYKRLKSSFDQLRRDHDLLKASHAELKAEMANLENMNLRLKTRLSNKSCDPSNKENQTDSTAKISKYSGQKASQEKLERIPAKSACKSARHPPTSPEMLKPFVDLLVCLCDWLNATRLDQSPPVVLSKTANVQLKARKELGAEDRCHRLFPSFIAVLPFIVRGGEAPLKVQLPLLQFLHWSLFASSDWSKAEAKSSEWTRKEAKSPDCTKTEVKAMTSSVPEVKSATPSASLRHLGEILHGDKTSTREGMKSSSSSLNIFYRSPNPHVKFLSSLLLLRTLTQTDVIAKVLESVKVDLKDECAKEYFVAYRGTSVLMQFVRPSHKQGLLSSAVDVLGIMTLESLSLPAFLQSCSNEMFFRQISALLRTSNLSSTVLEKIATILSKLSKFHSNRRFFDAFAFPLLLSKMLSECGPEHAFLALGLKTILVNISSGVSSGYSSGIGAAAKGGTKLTRSESNSKRRNFGSSLSLQSDVSSGAASVESMGRCSRNDLNKS